MRLGDALAALARGERLDPADILGLQAEANRLQGDVGSFLLRSESAKGLAKAWVKFTGSTGAIVSSFGVTSVVRNSTGNYTITFSAAFGDANYVMAGAASATVGDGTPRVVVLSTSPTAPTATVCTVMVYLATGGVADQDKVFLVFFGN